MSADNYYLVKRHPAGGYVALMGFASDTDEDGNEITPEIEPDREYPIFDTVTDAVIWAANQYAEYGVSIEADCKAEYASEDPDYDLPDADTAVGPLSGSHAAVHAHDARWAATGLLVLAEAISEARRLPVEPDGTLASLITGGAGADYATDAFGLRAYCGCAGTSSGHQDGCPPNFEHPASGLVISWLAPAGVGLTANQPRPADWSAILTDCLISLHRQGPTA